MLAQCYVKDLKQAVQLPNLIVFSGIRSIMFSLISLIININYYNILYL